MKVYISSTYQDLVDHRTAVDRTLRRMGHDVIGMEQYVAEGSKPVDRCKADVGASNACVIIVAWRFGLSMNQVQQIVDSLLPDVPVQRRKKAPATGFELLVVDRDAFALELAREWIR